MLINRYINALPENYEIYDKKQLLVVERLKNILNNLRKYIEKGQWFLFWGYCGTGKTFWANIFYKRAQRETIRIPEIDLATGKVTYIVRPVKAKYILAHKIINISKDFDIADKKLKQIADFDFLVIDEFGIGYNTPHEKILFHQLLGYRYDYRLSTLIVTNMDEQGIVEYVTPPVLDRLKEAEIFAFTWQSYRERGIK